MLTNVIHSNRNPHKDENTMPFPPQKTPSFTFIDLFAGIGGFRIALQNLGGKCVFSSEIDKYAQQTYLTNFGELPFGDITLDETKGHIPKNFDILCGGFPCQAFSIAGRREGFDDTRGTLFFEIAEIVKKHRPKVVFLENVKNLISHDKGKTLSVILNMLGNELNYQVSYQVLNASHFGLPQNRERIYIIGFRKDIQQKFHFPSRINSKISLNYFLEEKPEIESISRPDTIIYKQIDVKTNLFNTQDFPNKPIQIGRVNKGGQGERIYHPIGHAITLSAFGGGVGAKTGLYFINGKIRRLTPRECARVQGFPETFILNNSKNECYKQFGNTVAINVVEAIAKNIISYLKQ